MGREAGPSIYTTIQIVQTDWAGAGLDGDDVDKPVWVQHPDPTPEDRASRDVCRGRATMYKKIRGIAIVTNLESKNGKLERGG